MKTNSGTLNNKAKNVFMTKTERQNKKKIQERNRNRVSFSGHLPFPESKLTTLTQVQIKKKMELKLNPPKLTNLFSGISFFPPFTSFVCVAANPSDQNENVIISRASVREQRRKQTDWELYTFIYIYIYTATQRNFLCATQQNDCVPFQKYQHNKHGNNFGHSNNILSRFA